MTLWYVCYIDGDGGSADFMVSAPTAIEAFVAWRLGFYPDKADWPEPLQRGVVWPYDREEARVFPVPADVPDVVVHVWPYDRAAAFAINLDTLATQAIEEALRIPLPS